MNDGIIHIPSKNNYPLSVVAGGQKQIAKRNKKK
jgi:hypothetical protein